MARAGWLGILWVAVAGPVCAQTRPVVIDTDAGPDDILAISYVLSQPGVRVDAITVVNGTAHVDAGARNLIRLLEVAGRTGIPVFVGRSSPLRGHAEFPAEWRRIADELPGVRLPAPSRRPEAKPAVEFLLERLRRGPPARLLALGPLTNLGEALERDPSIAANIQELVIMGGAVRVPGNLADGGVFHTNNARAEWNLFVDPLAARIVFRSGVHIRLVPLDATNRVPVGLPFLREFQAAAHSPLGRVAGQVLESDRQTIEAGIFYAWDPLAAVALLHPWILKTAPLRLDVRQDPPEEGRTVTIAGGPNADVALDADAAAFRKLFLKAFSQ